MKKSEFTEAQIAFILHLAKEGTPVPEVCRKAGIGDKTFYNWLKKYAGLMSSEMNAGVEDAHEPFLPQFPLTLPCRRARW